MPKGPPDAFQLQAAVGRGDIRLVQRALSAGVEPNGIRSLPLLHRAVNKGFVDIIRLLVAAGADLERPNHAGWTALTLADADDHHECVDVLLAAGADPSARTRHGFTPLHRAARRGRDEDCRSLLRVGHDVNARATDGSTALLLAAGLCDAAASESTLSVLLHHGADPEIPDHHQCYPLDKAAYEDALHATCGDEPIVRVPTLLRAGADPNRSPYPPLIASISQGGHSWEVIDLLLSAGADPNRTDEDGWTIFHRAASVRTDSEFLVRCGAVVADVNAPDHRGRTAADLAFDDWSPEDVEDDDVSIGLLAAGVAGVSGLARAKLEQLLVKIADEDSVEHRRYVELRSIRDQTMARYGAR